MFLVFILVSMIAKAQFYVYKPYGLGNSGSTSSAPSSIGPFSVYKPYVPDNSRSTPIAPRRKGPFYTYTPEETVVTGKTYNATVLYTSSTGHENTYELPVVVNKGSVNKIIFNDKGGCVHVGINHSGYKYYGGELEYIKEYDIYATKVTIVYSDSWQEFIVLIDN